MEPRIPFRVLVFSKTAGYRHTSIPAGISGLKGLAASTNAFTVDASEDATLINAGNLSSYRVIIFLQNSGDFLNPDQLEGLKSYVRSGGGFVGIHCASAGLQDTPWYGELVGAVFTDHPEPQEGVVQVEDRHHAIVSGLPSQWRWLDEWYNFRVNPRGKVTVLLSIDEACYRGGTMGVRDHHPLAWCREFEGCRTFYTSLGHFDEAYGDARFMEHIRRGISWAARIEE
ncbi:carboxylesterase-like protein [Xylariomycetidae sp. FL2044]|nr:carboxylesterase-like protein [Xylariomycetidae sp. FL2044]